MIPCHRGAREQKVVSRSVEILNEPFRRPKVIKTWNYKRGGRISTHRWLDSDVGYELSDFNYGSVLEEDEENGL